MIVVMPMAGRGSRFSSTGIDTPKPLIEVGGRPMFSWALDSVSGLSYSKLITIVLQEHQDQFNISEQIRKHSEGNVEIIALPSVTGGQLCSVLAAKSYINNDEDVLIVPSDSLVISDMAGDIASAPSNCQGIISVAKMPGEHWSFARLGKNREVLQVAEKVRISEYASTGLYYFLKGKELVQTAEEMIAKNEKTQGEYYVIPVYEKYLQKSWKVMASFASELWDMGNPEALKVFKEKFI